MMRRGWLSLLLTVVMLVSLPITAYADSGGTEVPSPVATEEVLPLQEEMDFTEEETMEPPVEEVVAQEESESVAAISTYSALGSTIMMPSGGVTMNITGALEGIQEVSYYGTDGTFPAVKAWEVDTFPTQYTGLLPGGQVGFWLKPEYKLTVEGATVLHDDYFHDFLTAAVTDRKVDLQIPSDGTINIRIELSGELVPQRIPMTEYGLEDGAWLSANLESGQMGSGWITSGAVVVMQLKSGYTVEVLHGGQVRSVGGYYYPTTVTDSVGVTVEVDSDADEFVYAVVKQGEHYQSTDTAKQQTETEPAPEMESAPEVAEPPEAETAPQTGGMFTDVADGVWYAGPVEKAYSSGIVKGVTDSTFAPNSTSTRGQTVTMLYRAMGSPGGSAVFSDTSGEVASAAGWASASGVTNGVSTTAFDPNSSITREQLVTMLYRMAGSPAADTSKLASYSDGGAVQSYAQNAVAWAITSGILTGYNDGTIRPAATATRAEVCALIMRYLGAA